MSTISLGEHLEIFAIKRNNRYNDLYEECFNAEQKTYIAEQILSGNVGLAEIIKRYNMNYAKSTVQHWVKTIRNQKKLFEIGGRPHSIDKEGKEAIVKWVKTGGDTGNAMLSPTTRQLKGKIMTEVRETNKRKGDWGGCNTPDPKTVKRIMKEVQSVQVKGQRTTNARITASCDPRFFFTFAVMCAVCCAGLDPKLILNWDATTFGVSKDDTDDLVYIKDEDFDNNKPVTGESSGDTCLFVKLYHYHNAYGTIAAPVFVCADSNLSEGAFEQYEVKGLSRHGGEGNGTGYLCFTKTRAANDEFYKWFNEKVIVPFIVKTREDNDMVQVFFFCLGRFFASYS